MSTDTLEHADTTTIAADGDHERFSHYFPKKELDRAMFEGVPAKALCGKVEPAPFRNIDGRTVCPTCKEIYDALPD